MLYAHILEGKILPWTTIPRACKCAFNFSNLNSLTAIRDVCSALTAGRDRMG